MNKQNLKNGWTPELVDWAERVLENSEPGEWHGHINVILEDVKKNGIWYGIILGVLDAEHGDYADLIQALPAEALEVFKEVVGWVGVKSRPGERDLSSAYRVKADSDPGWEVGELVE